MNIIIVGCGKVGSTIIDLLATEKHNIIAIDKDSDKIQSLTDKYDIMGLTGSCTNYETLMSAGIERADLLIAVTSYDEVNLLCCLFARKIGKCETIARVRDPEYNRNLHYIKDDLGLTMAINPEHAAAIEMSRVIRMPSAIEISAFAKGGVELLKFKVNDDSKLVGMSLIDISQKIKGKVLICVVERGDEVFIPSGPFVIAKNDLVSIIGSPRDSHTFLKDIGIYTNAIRNVMIVGGGKIGYYLASELLPLGIDVKIIESDKDRCYELADLLPQSTIINGDGTDTSLITEEGIDKVGAFVTMTGLDESNVMLSLYAKVNTKAKIITKLRNISNNNVIKSLELGTIVSPEKITADNIVKYVRAKINSIGSNVESLYKLIKDRVEAVEFYIREESEVVGVPLMELPTKDNLLVACISRGGKIIRPSGRDMILIGDTVIIVTTHVGIDNIVDILK